tara:strand:+ start:1551 stop:2273 length:723 start_codon:yes stop_codon:yes gene_type:complete
MSSKLMVAAAATGATAALIYYYLKQRTATAADNPPYATATALAPKAPAPAAPAPAAPTPAAPAPAAPAPATPAHVHVLHSGDFGADVAQILCTKIVGGGGAATSTSMNGFKKWAEKCELTTGSTPVCAIFVVATIENEQPPEDAGPCVRYFSRRTHPDGMLSGKLQFAVLGLGDSNLLLDRQTTTAKDCNQVAKKLDARLAELGAERVHALGMSDDRTGNLELEPFMNSFVKTMCGASPR